MRIFYLALGIILITYSCVGMGIKGSAERRLEVEGKIVIIKNAPTPFERELGIMNADGSNYRPVPNVPRGDIHNPRWSPNGKKIVFDYRGEYDKKLKKREYGIYIVNEDGSNLKKVYSNFLQKGIIEHPSFSPDGKQIVFIERDEICIVNIDGSNLTRLTNNAELREGEKVIRFYKYYPSYSPDRSKIVFCGKRSIYKSNKLIIEGTANVFIINSDSSEMREVVSTNIQDGYFCPRWSPDGKKIAFSQMVINADGSNLQKLHISGGSPQWSSDGKKIMYKYAVSTDWPFFLWQDRIELYIANADGTEEKLIKRWKGKYSDIAFEFDWWTPRKEE